MKQLQRFFLLALSLPFFFSCSLLKEKVDFEKYSKETKLEVKKVGLQNKNFEFSTSMDSSGNFKVDDISVKPENIFGVLLSGDFKSLFTDLQLKLGLEVSNAYPFSFSVTRLKFDIYFSGIEKKITTVTYEKPFQIKEGEKQPIDLLLDIPEELSFGKLVKSKSVKVKGTASVSLVTGGTTFPAIPVPFEKEVDIPTKVLQEKLESAKINLDNV